MTVTNYPPLILKEPTEKRLRCDDLRCDEILSPFETLSPDMLIEIGNHSILSYYDYSRMSAVNKECYGLFRKMVIERLQSYLQTRLSAMGNFMRIRSPELSVICDAYKRDMEQTSCSITLVLDRISQITPRSIEAQSQTVLTWFNAIIHCTSPREIQGLLSIFKRDGSKFSKSLVHVLSISQLIKRWNVIGTGRMTQRVKHQEELTRLIYILALNNILLALKISHATKSPHIRKKIFDTIYPLFKKSDEINQQLIEVLVNFIHQMSPQQQLEAIRDIFDFLKEKNQLDLVREIIERIPPKYHLWKNILRKEFNKRSISELTI